MKASKQLLNQLKTSSPLWTLWGPDTELASKHRAWQPTSQDSYWENRREKLGQFKPEDMEFISGDEPDWVGTLPGLIQSYVVARGGKAFAVRG